MIKVWLALALLLAALSSVLLSAESICVKYGSCQFDVSEFECSDTTNSSFVRRVCYDAKKRFVVINLAGTWYPHCEVDGTVRGNGQSGHHGAGQQRAWHHPNWQLSNIEFAMHQHARESAGGTAALDLWHAGDLVQVPAGKRLRHEHLQGIGSVRHRAHGSGRLQRRCSKYRIEEGWARLLQQQQFGR